MPTYKHCLLAFWIMVAVTAITGYINRNATGLAADIAGIAITIDIFCALYWYMRLRRAKLALEQAK